jgi:hypothetical protein
LSTATCKPSQHAGDLQKQTRTPSAESNTLYYTGMGRME